MPPRLVFSRACRSLAVRTRPLTVQPRILQIASRRGFADEKDPKPASGRNQDVLGHVSEEAAHIGKVTGETGPDVGQGTPVQDVRLQISSPETSTLLENDIC
jgi:small subunit ribosomal protein S7